MLPLSLSRFNAPDVIVTPAGTLSMAAQRVLNELRTAVLQQRLPTPFANLPLPATEGMVFAITDSTVNTWGSTIAGGGANHVLGYFNGTHWTVIGT